MLVVCGVLPWVGHTEFVAPIDFVDATRTRPVGSESLLSFIPAGALGVQEKLTLPVVSFPPPVYWVAFFAPL